MFLSHSEYEAFLRGKAAGLIPADLSLPQNEKEIDNLIFHVGLMFSVRIAYRNRQMKLHLMELSSFTEEHLENIIYRLPCDQPDSGFAETTKRPQDRLFRPAIRTFPPDCRTKRRLRDHARCNNHCWKDAVDKSQYLFHVWL